jgi:hypothetical protein
MLLNDKKFFGSFSKKNRLPAQKKKALLFEP